MHNLYTFLRRLTGFPASTTDYTAHLNRRLVTLGALMLFIAGANGVVLVTSLRMNAYAWPVALAGGGFAFLLTLITERFIVSTIAPPRWQSWLYRTLLLTVMVGSHLIFVDLALHHNALEQIGIEQDGLRKDRKAAPLGVAQLQAKGRITSIDLAADSLKTDRTARFDRAPEEARGNGSTGRKGNGKMTAYEEAVFEKYDTLIYQPAQRALALRRAAAVAERDSLASVITTIYDEPYDYNAESLITKLMYLTWYLERPGNEAAWYVMLFILLAVMVLEFAVVFARGRLEDGEIRRHHELAVASSNRLAAAREETATRAGLLRERTTRRANDRKEASDFMHRQADDIHAHHNRHALRMVDVEREEQRLLRGRSVATREAIGRIYARLRTDLDNLFSQYSPNA